MINDSSEVIRNYDLRQVKLNNGVTFINGEIEVVGNSTKKNYLLFVVKNNNTIIDLNYLTTSENILYKREVFSDFAQSFFINDKKLIPPRSQVNSIDTILLELPTIE